MKNNDSTQSPIIWYLAALAVIFLVLNSSNKLSGFKDTISNIFQPFSYSGVESSKKILTLFDGIGGIENNVIVVNGLKERIGQLESKLADYDLLQEKYDSLLLHSKTANKKYEYIQAGVHIGKSDGQLILDIGRKENVNVNDIVVFGNVFVGKVISVDSNSSLVRTPDDFGSNIEVIIQKVRKSNNLNNPVRAIAVGDKNKIVIENIASSSGVTNGDLVIVDDKNIGGFLTMGTITGISQDKAASILTAFVANDLDLLLTKFVYIRK